MLSFGIQIIDFMILILILVSNMRTFRDRDGCVHSYNFDSDQYRQRKPLASIALVSHVEAQSSQLIEWLTRDTRGPHHLVISHIADDTNVPAAWANNRSKI